MRPLTIPSPFPTNADMTLIRTSFHTNSKSCPDTLNLAPNQEHGRWQFSRMRNQQQGTPSLSAVLRSCRDARCLYRPLTRKHVSSLQSVAGLELNRSLSSRIYRNSTLRYTFRLEHACIGIWRSLCIEKSRFGRRSGNLNFICYASILVDNALR